MKLGAHQSIAGGYQEALKRIKNIGGNCLQIFSSSPRGWTFSKVNNEEINKFLILKSQYSIDPIYFHASYLINLADEGKISEMSIKSLINELNLAPKLNIKGSIIHLGSFKGEFTEKKYQKLIENIKIILKNTPKNSLFIIENSGTRKIGQNLEELNKIIQDLDNDRVKICLDTCHLFSNGYKFENKNQLDDFLNQLKKLNLLNRLEVWHLNDSKDEFNSGKDRHENIGQGKIDIKEFKTLLNHPLTKNYPFIIETPGFKNEGPDKKNLDILKKLTNN